MEKQQSVFIWNNCQKIAKMLKSWILLNQDLKKYYKYCLWLLLPEISVVIVCISTFLYLSSLCHCNVMFCLSYCWNVLYKQTCLELKTQKGLYYICENNKRSNFILFWNQDNIDLKKTTLKMAPYEFDKICTELFYTFPD